MLPIAIYLLTLAGAGLFIFGLWKSLPWLLRGEFVDAVYKLDLLAGLVLVIFGILTLIVESYLRSFPKKEEG